jgi:integrase
MSNDLRSIQKQLEKLSAAVAKQAGDSTSPTFGEVAAKFLTFKLNKVSLRESTKTATKYQHKRNLIAFADIPIDQFSASHWDARVAEIQAMDDSVKPLTRFFNFRKATSEVLNYAHNEGMIDRKPKLDNPDEHRNVGRVVTDAEFELIQANVTYPIFQLFFFTLRRMGCRPREILRWEWDMITWPTDKDPRAWIAIPARISKTVRSREIPINTEVWAKLLEWRAQGPMNSKYVFPNRRHPGQPQLSYHGAWKTACTKAGVAKCVPYDYRRTFITYKIEAREPEGIVAKFLDTSPLQIQNTYLKPQKHTLEGIAG